LKFAGNISVCLSKLKTKISTGHIFDTAGYGCMQNMVGT